MNQFYVYISLVMLIFYGSIVRSQDIHFSHIHASPTVLNPALTGLFEGDIRIISNYRQQWQQIPVNYRTVAISGDMSLLNTGKLDFISGGIQLLDDRAGDLNFGNTQLNLSTAFTKALDRFGDNYLTLGIQSSVINQSMDVNGISAFDDEPLTSGDGFNNRTYGDISAGLSLFSNPNRQWMLYLGTAIFHIGRPIVNSYGIATSEGDRLYRRWVVHGGLEYNPNDYFQLMPSFIFMTQGPHQELTIGTFMRMSFQLQTKMKENAKFYIGAWLRGHINQEVSSGVDALILSLRLDHRQLSYAFSYDVNISSLSVASNFRGGPELSIIYTHKRRHKVKHRKRMKCPRF